MNGLNILGINGCNEKNASSLHALRYCLHEAEKNKVETDVFDLAKVEIPIFSVEAMKNPPAAVISFISKIKEADALIWSTPLYHGSLTGILKNALDWLEILRTEIPPYLTHKVVGLICVAGGNQGIQGINSMNFIARALRAWTIPYSVAIADSYRVFDKDGNLNDQDQIEKLNLLARELIEGARLMSNSNSNKQNIIS